MTNSTVLDVWNPRSPISTYVAVTKGTVQIDLLFVNQMIKPDRLVDGLGGEDREDRIEDCFGLIPESIISDGS